MHEGEIGLPHLGGLSGFHAASYYKRLKTPAFVHLPETLQPRIFYNSSTIAEMSQYHANSFNNMNSFNNTNSFNNANSFNNVWNNCTVADDRSQLLAWLSPLEPRLRHQDIQGRRVGNIGEWLMQTEEFRSWRDESREGEDDKAVLFGYGDPGAGKTFIR